MTGQPILILLLLVLLAGCATPVRVIDRLPEPQTLAEVNARLVTASSVTILLVDGDAVGGASEVTVTAAEVRFVLDGEPAALPTERVAEIDEHGRGQAMRGAGLGATPGLAIAGLALLGLASASEENENIGGAIALAVMISTGLVAAFTGGVAGGIVGSRVEAAPGARLYRGPVERYVAPSAETASSGR